MSDVYDYAGKAYEQVAKLKQEVDSLRLAIGANEGESTIDALHRYTFAVQLGCAMKLERWAEDNATAWVPAFHGAARVLMDGIPAYIIDDYNPNNPRPDAIARWKAEQVQAIKEGWLEVVFERAWQELLGDIPSNAAKARFRQLLEEYEPGDAPTRGPSRDPEADEAEGARIVNEHNTHIDSMGGPDLDSPDYRAEEDEFDSGDVDVDDSSR